MRPKEPRGGELSDVSGVTGSDPTLGSDATVGSDATFDASFDQRYFLAIEEHFLRLRGAPMMLSPADWRIARGWREDEIPLTVVHRVIEQLFARRRERGAKGRVQGLRFFDDAVRSAWAEILELRGPEGPSPTESTVDVGERLDALVESLPKELPALERWRARILDLAAGEAAAPEVELALAALDRELIVAAREWLDAESLAEEMAEVERALASLRGRLDEAGLAEARDRLLDRRLRDRFELPELSLFAGPRRT